MAGLRLEGLTLRRRGFQLGPLDLELGSGSRTALLGASGAGKTTLLRCLAGLEHPDGGVLTCDGVTLHGGGSAVPAERRGVAFVFQDGALWAHMTALQHLQFVAPARPVAALRDLLAEVGLAHAAERRPEQLSGGEAQRLGLVRALAQEPRLLLLDEPLRSVDSHRRDELAHVIAAACARRRLTAVLVTHDRDEVFAFAERVVCLAQGRVAEHQDLAAALAAPATAFTAAFLGGAACLPVGRAHGVLRTPLGEFPAAAAPAGDVQLAVLPGDVRAIADPAGPGEVLCALPGNGRLVRVAFAGHSLTAAAVAPIARGARVRLELLQAPRFLPVVGMTGAGGESP
jgi:ABC-type sulfate/molybdate transport systems ATPase subunit